MRKHYGFIATIMIAALLSFIGMVQAEPAVHKPGWENAQPLLLPIAADTDKVAGFIVPVERQSFLKSEPRLDIFAYKKTPYHSAVSQPKAEHPFIAGYKDRPCWKA